MVTGVNRQWVEGGNYKRGTVDSGREMVVNTVRRDGAGWEAIVEAGKTRHGDPVVQRRRLYGKGSDVQEVTTLVPKYVNIIFLSSFGSYHYDETFFTMACYRCVPDVHSSGEV